jgi:HTH-type transcriptional regulator / antitoxin HigA
MEILPIKSDNEYQLMLDWVGSQFDAMPDVDSADGQQLQIALLLIKAYEDVHYKIPVPDAIKAVKQKMEEKGLQNKDLVQWIGSKGYVSALLNKKKPMTLKLAKIIHQKLGIPAGVILQ